MTNMTTDPARIALSIRQPWVELILVGRCELTDCIEFTPATWEEWRGRHHNPGPLVGTLYAWLLENPVRSWSVQKSTASPCTVDDSC
jgi:hypothetical protein